MNAERMNERLRVIANALRCQGRVLAPWPLGVASAEISVPVRVVPLTGYANDADVASLEAFAEFRADCAANDFKYFLEVFNPNAPQGLSPEDMPAFVNDSIVRCLAGLTKAERADNIQGAFRVPDAGKMEVSGRRLVLVDDVLTSGATANACARALLRAGAAQVDILVFARVVEAVRAPI